MNRIDELFLRKKKDVLGIYFTAGFPRSSGVVKTLVELEAVGVDFVEIGMPFSDPLADGPVIQASSAEALAGGMTLQRLFGDLERMRQEVKLPVVLMGYMNPVIQYGFDSFLERCKRCGVDGLILPDLPLEEYEEHYKASFSKYGIYPILLVTPNTPDERLKKIVLASKGFVYLVSSTSTTGSSGEVTLEHRKKLETATKKIHGLPVMVGFGIHNASTFASATEFSQGGIVGTAFIRQQSASENERDAVTQIMNQLNIYRNDCATV